MAPPTMNADVIPCSGSPVAAVVDAYEQSAQSLVRFATMLVGPAEAEDVVSDALIRVLDQAELAPEILAAVRGLSQQQRSVIFLTYWADLAPMAVAEYLGISEGSVRKQLARARAKLATVLTEKRKI